MTFAATIQADTLSDAIAPLTALVNEAKLNLTSDGLESQAVDPANVGMVSVEVDCGGFASYSADGGVIGVNLERFADVIGMADSDDMIHLKLDEQTRKLSIEFSGLAYTLALIDPDSIRDEPDIPDLDLPGTYVFKGGRLSRAITATDLVSDHIAIEASADDELVVSAEGDTDDVSETLGSGQLLNGNFNGSESVESLYSLDYFTDITKPIGTDTEVSMLLGAEMPVKLRYSLSDGDVSILNMIAPRIAKGD